MKSYFSLPVIDMYVLPGVSGTRLAGMSALKTKVFLLIHLGWETEKKSKIEEESCADHIFYTFGEYWAIMEI